MAARFSYTGETTGPNSDAYRMPRLSLRLHHGDRSANVVGLLDSPRM
jgi:hypothetical protein